MSAAIPNETIRMIINRAVLALEMVTRTLHGVENASELVEAAVARHSVDVARSVSNVSDMISNASLENMITSPQVSAVVRVVTSNRRPVVEKMPLSFEKFSLFAMDVEADAAPIAENEFVIVPLLYNSSSYRNRVEKKDASAPKFGAYKAAKEAEYKTRGVCFDRDAFMVKAEGAASSIKAKLNLWSNYCVCRDLLMGFKKYEIVRRAAGERPTKRARKNALATVAIDARSEDDAATDVEITATFEDELESEDDDVAVAPAVDAAPTVVAPAVAAVDSAVVAAPAVAAVDSAAPAVAAAPAVVAPAVAAVDSAVVAAPAAPAVAALAASAVAAPAASAVAAPAASAVVAVDSATMAVDSGAVAVDSAVAAPAAVPAVAVDSAAGGPAVDSAAMAIDAGAGGPAVDSVAGGPAVDSGAMAIDAGAGGSATDFLEAAVDGGFSCEMDGQTDFFTSELDDNREPVASSSTTPAGSDADN